MSNNLKIQKNIPLSSLTTMKIGGAAKFVVEVTTKDELIQALDFAKENSLPYFVLGGGSNILAGDHYDGLIILNRIGGISYDNEIVTAGAGVVLDDLCADTAEKNLSGIECMSGIPGLVGSTPVQNVGAYGQDISQTLISLEALDTNTGEFVVLTNKDCDFSYRNSIFKNPKTRHHIIVSVSLKLHKANLSEQPDYPSLNEYFQKNNITDFSPTSVRNAVLVVRAERLPSVDEFASAGSFFKNPILSQNEALEFRKNFPDAPLFELPEGSIKLFSGWLIENAGLKGYENFGMQIYPKNALVAINNSAKSLTDVENFTNDISNKVFAKFGVHLSREPDILQ